MIQPLKEIQMPPKKWVQIAGDEDYEEYGLMIGYYNPEYKEITVVEIEQIEEIKKYYVQEATYTLEELKKHTLEEFGIEMVDVTKHGLELIAEELLRTQGGEPPDCGALQDLRNELLNFDTALACAIGLEESFTDYNNTEVMPDKGKVNLILEQKRRESLRQKRRRELRAKIREKRKDN